MIDPVPGISLPPLSVWWPPALAAVGGLAVGIVVRLTILRWAAKAAAKTAWRFDDVLVSTISGPIVLWFVLIGLRLAVRLMPLTASADHTIGVIILVLGILAVTWAAARFSATMMAVGLARHIPNVSLLQSLVRVVVFLVGILIVFDTLGIAIKPIIGALGVGGLAVGLALQDTLANFFAGLRIIMAHKIRSGDHVKLETGQDGTIEDINWGLTTLKEGAGNMVIVPNQRLGSMIVTNYALPAAAQSVNVELGVSYDADLDKVERVVLEVARETLKAVPEGVADFKPSMRYKEFGEYSIRLFVVLQAKSQGDRWAVVSDFIKRVHKRFDQEGIRIPVRPAPVLPASP